MLIVFVHYLNPLLWLCAKKPSSVRKLRGWEKWNEKVGKLDGCFEKGFEENQYHEEQEIEKEVEKGE